MRDYAERCRHIARMFSIGSSVEGRPMWALEISKTPGKVEAKPNARIIGNMHGDEPASRSAFLYLSSQPLHHCTWFQSACFLHEFDPDAVWEVILWLCCLQSQVKCF